jgi:hypothetical protein
VNKLGWIIPTIVLIPVNVAVWVEVPGFSWVRLAGSLVACTAPVLIYLVAYRLARRVCRRRGHFWVAARGRTYLECLQCGDRTEKLL